MQPGQGPVTPSKSLSIAKADAGFAAQRRASGHAAGRRLPSGGEEGGQDRHQPTKGRESGLCGGLSPGANWVMGNLAGK